MKGKMREDNPPDGLRRQAEERLGERPGESGDDDRDLAIEAHRLVHELKVHQIELELQNEELKRARDDVEEALARYTDLYEFAPVGYLTLGQDGVIQQANLTGARLLGTRAFPAGGKAPRVAGGTRVPCRLRRVPRDDVRVRDQGDLRGRPDSARGDAARRRVHGCGDTRRVGVPNRGDGHHGAQAGGARANGTGGAAGAGAEDGVHRDVRGRHRPRLQQHPGGASWADCRLLDLELGEANEHHADILGDGRRWWNAAPS